MRNIKILSNSFALQEIDGNGNIVTQYGFPKGGLTYKLQNNNVKFYLVDDYFYKNVVWSADAPLYVNGIPYSAPYLADALKEIFIYEADTEPITIDTELSSGSTNPVANATIANKITEIETELDSKADATDIPSLEGYATEQWVGEQGYLTEHQSLTDYYTKSETSGSTEIADALALKADAEDIPSLEGYATEEWVGEQGYLTEHQSLSDYYTKSETSGASQISDALALKADTSITESINSVLTGHTANTDIHVTSSDKTAWDAKLDSSDLEGYATEQWVVEQGYLTEHQSLTDYYTKSETSGSTQISDALALKADTATTYTKSEVDNIVGQLDFDLYVVVTSLPTENIKTSKIYLMESETTGDTNVYTEYAYVNNDWEILGKYRTEVDLSDYYQKSETSGATEIANALNGKSDTGHTHTITAITDAETWITNKGYLTEHQSLTDYYQKSETSGATEISDALALKANTATTYTKSQVDTLLNKKQAALKAGQGISITNDEEDSDSYYKCISINPANSITDDEAQGAYLPVTSMLVKSALDGKSDTGHTHTITAITDAESWIANKGYLTEHQSLSDYYTKSETSGSTEIATALSGKADTATTYTKSEVDTALSGKQDTLSAGTNITISGNVISATGGGGAGAVELTQAEYDALAEIDPDTLYIISDASAVNMSNYYTKSEIDTALSAKQDTMTVDSALDADSENPVQNKVLYAALNGIETLLANI